LIAAMNLAALEEKLIDPVWRICSGELYSISPADGTGVQRFVPRPEQVAIVRAIYEDGAKQILIPKARRLGMSTTLGIIIADAMIFRKGFQASLDRSERGGCLAEAGPDCAGGARKPAALAQGAAQVLEG
jgi:hypothetical protein